MKILHVGNHTTPCVGGIETVIWDSARAMEKMGHEVGILVFDTCTDGKTRLPAREQEEGVTIHRVPQGGFSFYRTPPLFSMLEIVKNYDVVHVHGLGSWTDFFVASKFLHRKPICVNSHGGFFHTKQRALMKNVYTAVVLPLVWRGIDYVFFDSEADAKHFSHLSHSKHSAVVPNGVNTNAFKLLPIRKSALNQFIFVGRLSRNKRIDHLIDAVHVASEKNPALRIHVVGADWEGLESELRRAATSKGLSKNIIFHGALSSKEMLKLIAACAFTVSASEYEGFGVSIIEAMSAGRIPVLNTIPTFEEFASENRGFVENFSNPRESGKLLLRASQLPLSKVQKMSQVCHAYAEKYSVNEVAKKHVHVYQKILNGAN